MRRVIVNFNDGSQATYNTMSEAAKALGCSSPSLHRILQGIAVRLSVKFGIKSIELKEPHGTTKGLRKRGGSGQPVLCENEVTGEKFICASMKEAKERTGFQHTISQFTDTQCYHWGWKFTSIEIQSKSTKFPNEIPPEIVTLAYKMGKAYLKKCFLHKEDAEDLLQCIVTHTLSDYSRGKYNSKYTIAVWLYLHCRSWGNKEIKKMEEWKRAKIELPEKRNDDDERTQEEWIGTLRPKCDVEIDIIREMPEHLRPLAECYIYGLVATEICRELGINEYKRQELTRELRQWLRMYNSDNG